MDTDTAQQAIEYSGCDTLQDLVATFGEMDIAEILESLQKSFPGEDCDELAENIHLTCLNAPELAEDTKYF